MTQADGPLSWGASWRFLGAEAGIATVYGFVIRQNAELEAYRPQSV
jgi:hypothetical protein